MDVFEKILCKQNVADFKKFWKAISLYVQMPHLVNRKLAGSEIVIALSYSQKEVVGLLHDYLLKTDEDVGHEDIVNTLKKLKLENTFQLIDVNHLFNIVEAHTKPNNILLINKLLPKNTMIHAIGLELITFDFENQHAVFNSIHRNRIISPTSEKRSLSACLSSSFNIQASVDDTSVVMLVSETESNTISHSWLERYVFPKLIKWMDLTDAPVGLSMKSHSLVNAEEYITKYNKLKTKYGKKLIEIWPECTDPLKFVYEDIAIASYLLVLWEQERKVKQLSTLQTFADLGCGNGLLVFILSSEGHEGIGIDVRKRGIWDMYPPTTVLETRAITPSDKSLFPQTDWIIGNHSDELSPWVPVIAARSSYNCRFFLLPCCAYNFDGRKFQRRTCRKSQYNDFVDYALDISAVCGFQTNIDRLKIPSTKRVCLIGNERIYPASEFDNREKSIQEFIIAQSEAVTLTISNGVWNSTFTPRSNVEKVKNCTKINKTIEKEIIDIVFQKLISKKRYLEGLINPHWNIGGRILLSDLVKDISRAQLKELKSECGGLQTLLKNNNQIFNVNNGHVEIRVPLKYADRVQEDKNKWRSKNQNIVYKYKSKPCWFYGNHPDGCLYDDENCSFKHD